jgi:phosphate starvation-inducible protein PhoH
MQPSDILLINGAHGTGKTIAALNAACMALKISDESRVLLCTPDEVSLIGMLNLIKRRDKYLNNVG